MDAFATKLRQIAQMTGMTQSAMAARLGVSFPAFNAWWLGKSSPRKGALAAVDAWHAELTGSVPPAPETLSKKAASLGKWSKEFPDPVRAILARPDVRDEMVLRLTYHSNSIEGSTLTEPETAAVLFQGAALPNRTLVEQMEAKNHQAALLRMFDAVAAGDKIDEAFVLRTHGIIMNGILPDAGDYRRHNVRIVGSGVPTANWLKVADLMAHLASDFSRKTADPVAHAAKVHAEFGKIHPFADGNGRVGRILAHAMLLSAKLAPVVIRQERRLSYYAYLRKAQLENEFGRLTDLFYDGVAEGYGVLEGE